MLIHLSNIDILVAANSLALTASVTQDSQLRNDALELRERILEGVKLPRAEFTEEEKLFLMEL